MISKSISVSRKLAQIAPFPALLFTWLIPHCDDGGNMAGDAFTIKALVVPARPETVKEVEAAMEEIVRIGLIERYEVNGEQYIHIVQWENHQTLRTDRATWEYPGKPSGNQPATNRQPAGAEGKVREGKVREGKNNNVRDDGFDAFWSSYPRRVNKVGAKRSWTRINPDPKLQGTILLALDAHKRSEQWTKDEGRFIPHPATWLNQKRWEDDLKPAKLAPGGGKFGAVKQTKV